MSDEERHGDLDRDDVDAPSTPGSAPDHEALDQGNIVAELERLERELYRVRAELSRFEEAVEERTVRRPDLESQLRRYVRQRMRRNRARGWGPYLVLLYGTGMTIGAFYFLSGGWSILAMIVVWLSTLGLYVLMVLFGAVLALLGTPSRLWDTIASRRR